MIVIAGAHAYNFCGRFYARVCLFAAALDGDGMDDLWLLTIDALLC